jgi:hypothetical protein
MVGDPTTCAIEARLAPSTKELDGGWDVTFSAAPSPKELARRETRRTVSSFAPAPTRAKAAPVLVAPRPRRDEGRDAPARFYRTAVAGRLEERQRPQRFVRYAFSFEEKDTEGVARRDDAGGALVVEIHHDEWRFLGVAEVAGDDLRTRQWMTSASADGRRRRRRLRGTSARGDDQDGDPSETHGER